MRRVLVLICIVAVTGACGSASAPSRAHALEAQVWSPYCPGRLLIDCTTRQARELRADIARRVDRGDENHEILDWISDEVGQAALARPSGGTTGYVIWLVPLVIFAFGSVFVLRAIRKWRPATAP